MNLVIVSGFLGAGKTTVLLGLAKRFSACGKRLAIVENEVGEVGIDDARLKAEGLEVREIYSGCVCCSLRMDLVAALMEIEREYAPDVVILEPSGVAGPKQVLGALVGYGGEINRKLMLSIVDAGRFDKIENMSIPLVTDGIEVADVVVVNKCDLVSDERLGVILETIKLARDGVEIVCTVADDDRGVGVLFDSLFEDAPASIPELTDSEKNGPKPTVYTEKITIGLPEDVGALSEELCKAVDGIVAELQSRGCTLIGHVKAIATSKGGGYLVVGRTDFDGAASVKGKIPKSASSATLTVAAIVYGVDKETVRRVVNSRAASVGNVVS